MYLILDHDAVLWVLAHYRELSRGLWPDPKASENLIRRKQVSVHADYENPCLLAGEVAARIRMCGVDGILLEEVYGINGKGMYRGVRQVAWEWHMKPKEVSSRMNKVTWYCTDDEDTGGRRQESYYSWKRRIHGSRKYRQSATTRGSALDKSQ